MSLLTQFYGGGSSSSGANLSALSAGTITGSGKIAVQGAITSVSGVTQTGNILTSSGGSVSITCSSGGQAVICSGLVQSSNVSGENFTANGVKYLIGGLFLTGVGNSIVGNQLEAIYGATIADTRSTSVSAPNLVDTTTCYITCAGTSGPGASSISFSMNGCKLSADSVNKLLIDQDAGGWTGGGGGMNLAGGTSAGTSSISAAAAAARTSLVSKGWVVTLNT